MRLLTVVILLAASAHAYADRVGADRAAAEAQKLAASGDFIGAAAKYREAFAAEPRADLMCNVGVAYYKAKDLPRAQRYLGQCLVLGTSLDRAFIENVRKVLAAVESTLAAGRFTPVDLFVQPPTATTSIEGGAVFDEPIVGSRRVWLPHGRYRLVVRAEGHVERVLEVEAKDATPIAASLVLERAPVETAPPSPAPPADSGSNDAADASVRAPSPPPSAPVAKRSMVAPIAATATTAVAGGFALGFFVAALGSADKAGKESDRARYDELKNEAVDRQHISWGFAAAAGAAAVVSGVLWYRYTRGPRIEVQASGTGAAVSFGGRW